MTEGSDSEKRMRELWRGLEASRVWGPGVPAAKKKRSDDMAQMLGAVVGGYLNKKINALV